jgi:tRNA(Ile)-lysidine synthase
VDTLPRNRVTGAFERTVQRALARCAPDAGAVIVGCSGGPDSTAALVAVARSGRRVVAAHFDHRMRDPASATADREAVARVASALGVGLVTGQGSGHARSEDDARIERYRWLAEAAEASGGQTCVTGHTLTDQAETVLLHITRGAGLAGASGMAESGEWPFETAPGARLILARPLLGISRAQVEGYLAALAVEARDDASNGDIAFSRNRIRHRVMPELGALNPRASEAIAGFAERARAAARALDQWAEAFLAEHATHDTSGAVVVERALLRALPDAVASRAIGIASARVGLRLDAAQTVAALRALGRHGARVDLAGGSFVVESSSVRISGRVPLDAGEGGT